MTRRGREPESLRRLTLTGLRVFRRAQAFDFGRLTLLAGANSSGKSTAMLAPLLLKQTIDATFDPGALRLDGPNASIASFDDLRSRGSQGPVIVEIETTAGQSLRLEFRRVDGDVQVAQMTSHGSRGQSATLRPGGKWRGRRVQRVRFLLGHGSRTAEVTVPRSAARAAAALEQILHVPGLRTPPQRDYPVTAIGETFPGRFDLYVASLLAAWRRTRDPRLRGVADDLRELGLTWKVSARTKSDTHVAIEVGRLPRAVRGGAHDMVEIADVGVGVSQALPVVVALHQARPGQLVYVEQPELHLHPRAQLAMARVLVAAAARGVRVVAETHSPLVLLGIQISITGGVRGLRSRDVVLHWFARDARTGEAEVSTVRLDARGAFAGSPADFDEVELAAHAAYLDAAEDLRRGR